MDLGYRTFLGLSLGDCLGVIMALVAVGIALQIIRVIVLDFSRLTRRSVPRQTRVTQKHDEIVPEMAQAIPRTREEVRDYIAQKDRIVARYKQNRAQSQRRAQNDE